MHMLKEKLMEEIYECEEKLKKSGAKISAGELQTLHMLTDTVKNIGKIEMMDDGGYSENGGSYAMGGSYRGGSSYARGGSRNSYDNGDSYANRGQHYVRGHYSRDDGREHMMGQLEALMDSAGSEKERQAIRRCMDQLRDA